MKTFTFNDEPSFAELWDVCVYNLLYKADEYKKDVEALFEKLGITKQSQIIDVSAGGGFGALELAQDGYQMVCVDGFADEVELFNQKAESKGIETRCTEALWKDLPQMYANDSFDFLFCRGNSFIYAGGGWNTMVEIKEQESLKNYKDTLKIFYDLLKPGGWIYVDKFMDSETSHREKVCEIKVNDGNAEDLIFWTERFSDKKIRQASMIRQNGDVEQKTPNITYDLLSTELISFLTEVGFKNIEEVALPSEQHFSVWIAQK
jgi:SAM-dependent methyltransferase